MKINPYFEINNKIYEIKPTRFLMVEYEKIGESNILTKEEKFNATKMQNMLSQLQDLANKLKELKDAYYADMTDKSAKAQYKACKEEYEEMFEEFTRFELENEGGAKLQKVAIDALERIAILGIAEQYYGYGKDGIRRDEDYASADKIWCAFVDENGKGVASEWLSAMAESLFGQDEDEVDENSFLAKIKAQKADKAKNKKNGFAKIR